MATWSEKTDGNKHVTAYVYDALNRVIQEGWVVSGTTVSHLITTTYDKAGQLIAVVEQDTDGASGFSYQYAYDRDGNQISSAWPPSI